MDPYDAYDLRKLIAVRDYSLEKLKPSRENRLEALKQFCGSHYGQSGEEVPLNYYELATTVFKCKIIGDVPRAYTSTDVKELKPTAADLKVSLDYMVDRTNLFDALEEAVLNSFFSWGVVKVGTSQGPHDSWWTDGYGEPFAMFVDDDDWVHDVTAKHWAWISMCGNKSRIPLRFIQDSDLYDREAAKRLEPMPLSGTTQDGDEKAAALYSGVDSNPEEYEDEVEIWDLWLPREGLIVTLPAEGIPSRPLRVVEWTGPPRGPYHTLGFTKVPSNILPLPPVAVWKDLHELANVLFLKLGRQAKGQKNILPVQGGNQDDIAAVNETQDGQAVRTDGQIPEERSFGGPNQMNLGFFVAVNDLINRLWGNLDQLGGLGSTAETLGQEEILDNNAGERIGYMRRRVAEFVDGILTSYAHYLYQDDGVNLSLHRPIPRTKRTVEVAWNAEARKGHPDLFKISIEPYSLVRRTPSSQARLLIEVIQTIIAPFAPEVVAQNMQGLLKLLADKLNLPELADVYLQPLPTDAVQQGNSPRAAKPSVTTRNYNRRSGSEPAGRMDAFTKLMAGGGGGAG